MWIQLKGWVFIIKLYTLLNAKIKNRNNSDESSLAIYHIHRDKEGKKSRKQLSELYFFMYLMRT